MNTLPILAPAYPSTLPVLAFSTYTTSLYPQTPVISQSLGFCSPKLLGTLPQSRSSIKSPSSLYPAEPQISDADDYEDDDEDDDVAADEYYDISGDVLEGVEQSDDETETPIAATEAPTLHEESKWQRVEKLCNEVRDFGEYIIDADELASIYDFRIDKFQVYFYANIQILNSLAYS